MDKVSKTKRSWNMSRIRSKNTKPELIVRKYLHSLGFRFRLHDSNIPGKPDIVLRKYKTAIQVRGCFWHAHANCKYFRIPSTKKKWWKDKLHGNRLRDIRNDQQVIENGWNLIIVWECELKDSKKEITLNRILEEITR